MFIQKAKEKGKGTTRTEQTIREKMSVQSATTTQPTTTTSVTLAINPTTEHFSAADVQQALLVQWWDGTYLAALVAEGKLSSMRRQLMGQPSIRMRQCKTPVDKRQQQVSQKPFAAKPTGMSEAKDTNKATGASVVAHVTKPSFFVDASIARKVCSGTSPAVEQRERREQKGEEEETKVEKQVWLYSGQLELRYADADLAALCQATTTTPTGTASYSPPFPSRLHITATSERPSFVLELHPTTEATATATQKATEKPSLPSSSSTQNEKQKQQAKHSITPLFLRQRHAAVARCRLFVVGAGGIGCEVVKDLVLYGFRNLTLIDLDTIDASNLNRQFLFRSAHVGKSKAQVVKEVADSWAAFLPHQREEEEKEEEEGKLNIQALHGNVKDTAYDADFYKQFTLVINGLDNVSARKHVNRICMSANVPLIESGTMGYNGQVQPILKGTFECYDCKPKPVDQQTFAVCTIHARPTTIVHCVHFAKELFGVLFGDAAVDGEGGADGSSGSDDDDDDDKEQKQRQKEAAKSSAVGEYDFVLKAIREVRSRQQRQHSPERTAASATPSRSQSSKGKKKGRGGDQDKEKEQPQQQQNTSEDAVARHLFRLLFVDKIDELLQLKSASTWTASSSSMRPPVPLRELAAAVDDKIPTTAHCESPHTERENERGELMPRAASFSASQQEHATSLTAVPIGSENFGGRTVLRVVTSPRHYQQQIDTPDLTLLFLYTTYQLLERGGKRVGFDKDDETAMCFVTAVANLRATVFNIPTRSFFDTKTVAGSIVPAIASTNAVISAAAVVQAVRVLEGQGAIPPLYGAAVGNQPPKTSSNDDDAAVTATATALTTRYVYLSHVPQQQRRKKQQRCCALDDDDENTCVITVSQNEDNSNNKQKKRDLYLLHNNAPDLPNPKCIICSDTRQVITIKLSAKAHTLGTFVTRFLMKQLSLVAPTVDAGPKNLYDHEEFESLKGRSLLQWWNLALQDAGLSKEEGEETSNRITDEEKDKRKRKRDALFVSWIAGDQTQTCEVEVQWQHCDEIEDADLDDIRVVSGSIAQTSVALEKEREKQHQEKEKEEQLRGSSVASISAEDTSSTKQITADGGAEVDDEIVAYHPKQNKKHKTESVQRDGSSGSNYATQLSSSSQKQKQKHVEVEVLDD